MDIACRYHSMSDRFRGFSRAAAGKVLVRNGRYVDLNIDGIHERSRARYRQTQKKYPAGSDLRGVEDGWGMTAILRYRIEPYQIYLKIVNFS